MTDDRSGGDHPRDELVEDARWLASTLERTHPDPYAGHGGRVRFHRALEELVRAVPEDGESVGRFARRVRAFAAGVRDGHTAVSMPDGADRPAGDAVDDPPEEGARFPLGFRVVGTALYVEAAYDDVHADLLRGRLVAVDGADVAELRARLARVESADNRYGDLTNLASALGDEPGTLARLLDGDATAPTLTVERPGGDRVDRVVEPVAADDPVATLATTVERPETSGEPAYRLLDGGDRALLVLPDCHSYRELHELTAAMGALDDLYDARETYRRVVGEPVPDDDDAVVEGLPAATEVLADLVADMADAGTGTLVVDVRDNGGGSSLLAYALVHALHGWDGVVTAAGDQYSVPKDSPLYREEYGDDGPLDDPDNPAGFDFGDLFADPEADAERLRERQLELSPTLASALEAGFPDYCPEDVLVVTSATTFSAGVEPAVLLSKLGATVVGVPSGQSPNGPRDVLFAELPNTGLDVRTSYRQHVFRPGEDGDVFEPDVELTPRRFEAFDGAGDAGVRLALASDRGEPDGVGEQAPSTPRTS